MICFDTETTPHVISDTVTEHHLKLGWACYLRKAEYQRAEKQDWLFFTDHVPFWDFVMAHSARKNRLWVLAHNMSFDFTVMAGFDYLRRLGFKVQFFHSSGKTTIIKVKAKGKSIVFVDTLNWFPDSLEKLGSRLGIPKLKIDFDNADFSYLKTYCKRDVEIIIVAVKSLMRFLEGNRISRLSYTIASTAMAAYLLKHYRHKIYIHNNKQAIDLERESYRGGRTECFRIGKVSGGPFYVLDVNSLYPFVMRFNKYPCKYHKIVHNISITQLRKYLRTYSVTASCLVETSDPVYAVKRERTIFPVGKFWVTLTTPEVKHALSKKHIKKLATVVLYKQADLFAGYVDYIYTLRKEFQSANVPLYEHFCKILLNSLYGKFGQKGEVWELIGDAVGEPDRVEDCIDAVTHRRKRLRYLLGQVWELTGHAETQHSFPAIAAHVTAYARLYLWQLITKARIENVFYCDTDSVFVNRAGLQNLKPLMNADDLGKLKLEYQTDTLTIYGLKDYVTADKTVIKGISRSAIKIADMEYRQEQWPSLRGLLHKGDASVYYTHKQDKTLKRVYTKGTVMDSGLVVSPVLCDELPDR